MKTSPRRLDKYLQFALAIMSNSSGATAIFGESIGPVTVAFVSRAGSNLARPRKSLTMPLQHHVVWSRSRFSLASVSSTDGGTASSEKKTVAVSPSSSTDDDEINQDDEYFDKLFDSLVKEHSKLKVDSDLETETVGGKGKDDHVKLVDFIEQTVGIQPLEEGVQKRRRGRAKTKDVITSVFAVEGNEEPIKLKGNMNSHHDKISDIVGRGSGVIVDEINRITAAPITIDEKPVVNSVIASESESAIILHTPVIMEEQPPPRVNEKKGVPFNVVCTHITADFDTLASAIGLAKLWSLGIYDEKHDINDSIANGPLPTYVVLPRGAHPDVQRFLSLHKHLFPIRSMKSLPGFSETDLKKGKNNNSDDPYEGLQRVGLVDAQRRDRLGPAEILLPHAKLGVTIVDHHVDAESDISEANNYIVENVGSVSTMITERLKRKNVDLTEAEATILALGIHSDTGSLVYDSTTPKDASMLGYLMEMGASQAAIAEHAKPTLSNEQQGVLTQSLVNLNSTTVHGVTISTVLLSADGFIPGLASVTKDALDLSSSDVFLLAVCYEATRGTKGGGGGRGGKGKENVEYSEKTQKTQRKTVKALAGRDPELGAGHAPQLLPGDGSDSNMINSESWKGGEVAFRRQRLAATFAFYDIDRSGYLDKEEILQALTSAGFGMSQEIFDTLMSSIDSNKDGKIDFEEFVYLHTDLEERKKVETIRAEMEGRPAPDAPTTMTIIGRVKAGVNVRNVNLNQLFQQFNGGGHPKAASATAKVDNEGEAKALLQSLVDELIEKSLDRQLTVGDFMQSPVLSAKPTMTEKQIEDLFIRYDVRALPVVDDNNEVIGLVSYKEVAAAKMRLLNKREKRLRQMEKASAEGKTMPEERPLESAVKGWMKQKVELAEASMTMAEVEQLLLETDVGCVPVVADKTKQLVGMVTRTDLLRQHRYYSTLHYHNKGFSDSIAARKPIIELRKRLKKFDVENE